MPANFFLGIDGGQSSTTAVIGDEGGRIVGTAVAGPCNHVSADESREKLTRVIDECVGEARRRAGMAEGAVFRAACAGMSGGPADKREILAEILRADSLLVTDDAAIALSGAIGGDPGLVVIAGTGSIAYGRNSERITARAGGWGYVFGDEGSAFDIVRQALRAALRQAEGWGGATLLSEMFLRETQEPDMNAVLHLFYKPGWPRARVAQLAALVDSLAGEGDPVAGQILDNAGKQLARLALAVQRHLWTDGAAVRTAYIGGVFGSGVLLESFLAAAEREGCDVIAPMLEPAAGALLEAYRMAGILQVPSRLVPSQL